ncbi:hypothetical protein EVAR_63237_1 [Eumeta japonica]|uniref:Uncharacterized protein n=1 Tax=Eumeta variegata TaxID=151549 RepID=A0A4C1ZAZ3_EUMVA|nr:hypothetical protein EVAR_63237_1 [Eumeta japonica]
MERKRGIGPPELLLAGGIATEEAVTSRPYSVGVRYLTDLAGPFLVLQPTWLKASLCHTNNVMYVEFIVIISLPRVPLSILILIPLLIPIPAMLWLWSRPTPACHPDPVLNYGPSLSSLFNSDPAFNFDCATDHGSDSNNAKPNISIEIKYRLCYRGIIEQNSGSLLPFRHLETFFCQSLLAATVHSFFRYPIPIQEAGNALMTAQEAFQFHAFTLCAQYNAQNSAAVKLVRKASQCRNIGTQGRRRNGRGALNLRIASSAGNSEQSSTYCPFFLTHKQQWQMGFDASRKKHTRQVRSERARSELRQRTRLKFENTNVYVNATDYDMTAFIASTNTVRVVALLRAIRGPPPITQAALKQ